MVKCNTRGTDSVTVVAVSSSILYVCRLHLPKEQKYIYAPFHYMHYLNLKLTIKIFSGN